MTPERYWLQLGFDACREMIINWQSDAAETTTSIEYREAGSGTWHTSSGTRTPHPFTEPGNTWGYSERLIHRVHLTGLQPGTLYEFSFPGSAETLAFRTLPDALDPERPVRACAAHDINVGPGAAATAALIAARSPDFLIVTGDWPYAGGIGDNLHRWDSLWAMFVEYFTLDEGGYRRVVPIVPGIGNHEVIGGYYRTPADGKYFYAYFSIPPGHTAAYYEVSAGDWLSLVVLDSEHSAPAYTGSTDQELWLDGVLAANAGQTHRLVTFHVPYYEAHGTTGTTPGLRGRTHIASRLEAAGIRTVLVGHAHNYHRTVRIAGEAQVAEEAQGVRYFGAGAWGRSLRGTVTTAEWYTEEGYALDEPRKARHFYELFFYPDRHVVESRGRFPYDKFHSHVEPAQAPPAPTITDLTGSGSLAMLTWDDVAGGYKYRVYTRARGSAGEWELRAETTELRAALSGLDDILLLEYAVTAINDYGESVPSEPVVFDDEGDAISTMYVQYGGATYPVVDSYVQFNGQTVRVLEEVVHWRGQSITVWRR